jgi:flavin-dependent dehydrogenase
VTANLDADVVVVGGGPAGSAAVRALAGRPLSVIWIVGQGEAPDKAMPGPVETLDAGVMAYIEDRFCVDHRACGARAYAWPVAGATSQVRRGVHVLRHLLDRALRDAALQHTRVRVIDNVARTGRRNTDRTFSIDVADGTRVMARFLIDATGRRHWLARQLRVCVRRITPPLLLARSVSAAAGGTTPLFLGRDFGWLWHANEGVDQSTWNLMAAARHPRRRAAIAEARGTATQPVEYVDTTWRMVRPAAAETHAFAGEAAMVLDPASGDGIETALRLGHDAARLASVCLSQPDIAPFAAARYDDTVHRAFRLRADELRRRYQAMGLDLTASSTETRAVSPARRALA